MKTVSENGRWALRGVGAAWPAGSGSGREVSSAEAGHDAALACADAAHSGCGEAGALAGSGCGRLRDARARSSTSAPNPASGCAGSVAVRVLSFALLFSRQPWQDRLQALRLFSPPRYVAADPQCASAQSLYSAGYSPLPHLQQGSFPP